jgi:quercetin dioxygenase-like cupin family protein
MPLDPPVQHTVGDKAAVLLLEQTAGEPIREGFQRRILYTGKGLMSVVLDIDNGPWPQPDPPHSHPHEQVAYVASGEILFLSEGRAPVRLTAGDLYAIPPNVPHSIQLLSKTARLVDTFTPIREDFLA